MSENPFPGPQPYRASDRERFFGREDMAYRLEGSVVAQRCVTVYGPSGAGKSSLMQASVIPSMVASHGVRAVRVDGWPEGEDPTAWLASATYAQLGLGDVPDDVAAGDAIVQAAQRAARRSSRLLLIYLDQIEQLLYASRNAAEVDTFFEQVQTLVELPLRNARVVLSLREDYLGRFRDRLRDRGRLLDNGFRVGPLTVAELCDAVCRAAASGQPPQRWSATQMRELMLQVRVPGEAPTDTAEAQAAYAQIVCRALFQERAQGRPQETTFTGLSTGDTLNGKGPTSADVAMKAESILYRYLETTLDELGPLAADARRLLEDQLVTADGTRTLRTEKELSRIVAPDKLGPILSALERAAILHAEAHQGSRYFEIGHDWLAKRVHDWRMKREQAEEARRIAAEQEEALRKQRAEADARVAKERKRRRTYAAVAIGALFLAVSGAALAILAFRSQRRAEAAGQVADKARADAEAARHDADRRAVEASDARLLAGFRELKNSDQLPWATKLLAEVQRPGATRGWVALASDAVRATALERTLKGHKKALSVAAWSPDGTRVLTASADRTARVWTPDEAGDPILLEGHDKPVTVAVWSPDGTRVLTGSEDGTLRLWHAGGGGQIVKLDARASAVSAAAWSRDGARVAVTWQGDAILRVYEADGSKKVELKGHKGPLTSVAFHADGERVLTASEDKTARLWSTRGDPPVVFDGHKAAVMFVASSPDGSRVLTTSRDRTARVWSADGKGQPVVLEGHSGGVSHAAWSPDGTRVATGAHDATLRIWSADGKGEPVVLTGHTLAVTFVAFRQDGRYVATASRDRTARLWPADGGTPLVLSGHEAAVRQVTWSPPDGARVLTAAWDDRERSRDASARVFRTTMLPSLPREQRGFFHAASIGANAEEIVAAYDDGAARRFRADGKGEPVIFRGHKEWVSCAAPSPDGTRVVTGSFDATLRVWQADGKGEPVVLEGHKAAVRTAAWSPDGKRIVSASDDRTAIVHAADGKGPPVILAGHADALTSAAWSADGKRIVTTSLDNTARLWRADGSGTPVVLQGHGGDVNAAVWSPDGKLVATASQDGTAQVWDAESGAPVLMMEHWSPVSSVAWSANGKRVASSSQDGSTRVWNADGRGEPILLTTSAPMIAMAFIEGDRTLFGVAADDTSHAFTIDVATLKKRLATANADCLPDDMRVTYFGETPQDAKAHFAQCEGARGQPLPAPPEPPAPANEPPGPMAPRGPKAPARPAAQPPPADHRRVPLIVLPGDALVEVDGQPLRRRDGVIELTGKVGETHRVRAFKGLRTTEEKTVTILGSGADPSLLDVNAVSPGAQRKAGKTVFFDKFDD